MLLDAARKSKKVVAEVQNNYQRKPEQSSDLTLFVPSRQLLHDVLDILLRWLWPSHV